MSKNVVVLQIRIGMYTELERHVTMMLIKAQLLKKNHQRTVLSISRNQLVSVCCVVWKYAIKKILRKWYLKCATIICGVLKKKNEMQWFLNFKWFGLLTPIINKYLVKILILLFHLLKIFDFLFKMCYCYGMFVLVFALIGICGV